MEKGIQILGQSIEYAMRVIQRFNLDTAHPTPTYPQLKLGRAQGLSLETEPVDSMSEEPHITDQEEVLEYGTLTLEDWNKDPKPFLEQIAIQFCRGFGISLEDKVAKSLVVSALG